jgi:nucleoid-associated protein YgaU
MGIVDFVKEAGRKIGLGEGSREAGASVDAERDERLRELQGGNELLRLILEMNQGVENPRVEFNDGVATVWGKAPNQAVRENTILVIGNVQGVARVDDRMEVVEPGPSATFYTVKKGDTLSAIAQQQYGDAGKYPKIFEANRPMLEHPDRIYPGQVLRIPEA